MCIALSATHCWEPGGQASAWTDIPCFIGEGGGGRAGAHCWAEQGQGFHTGAVQVMSACRKSCCMHNES